MEVEKGNQMSEKCEHHRVTEFLHRLPATMWEPEEIVGRAVCDECGKLVDLDDVSEDTIVTEVWQ